MNAEKRRALLFEIRSHLQRQWPSYSVHSAVFPHSPIAEVIPDFEILHFSPPVEKEQHIYATVGASLADPNAHLKHEFLMFAPWENPSHNDKLAMLASFHADPRFRLDVGSVAEIGEPWIMGSQCDHYLITLTYPIGPQLEWLETDYGCIRFLWALPITKAEAAFVKSDGLEALEKRFDEQGINYLDPKRTTVI